MLNSTYKGTMIIDTISISYGFTLQTYLVGWLVLISIPGSPLEYILKNFNMSSSL